MELQEFIKDTLVQIATGVIEAQKQLKQTDCLINPEGYTVGHGDIRKGYNKEYRSVQKVKMNVVLNITESTESKSGIGVAKVIQAGINNEEKEMSNKVTSIEFEVPIAFPVMEH